MTKIARSNRRRWAVPVVALLAVFGVGAVPGLLNSASAGTPDLPTLTPAELLAKARTARVTSLSGTIRLVADLGLPDLGSITGALGGGSSTSPAALLSGTHTAQVWVDGPTRLRLATAAPMTETNWIRNGDDLWSYDSATNHVVHATLTPHTASAAHGDKDGDATGAGRAGIPDAAHETPVQFAQQLLDKVTPSTDVRVDSPRYVADRPVYQLVLSPKAAESTVRDVTISVDAATGLPLDVRIDPRSSSKTALEFGFTAISFDKPAASTFAFTPPPGATVTQADPSALLSPGRSPFERRFRMRRALRKGAKGAPVMFRRRDGSVVKLAPGDAEPVAQATAPAKPGNQSARHRVKVLGHEWTTVAVFTGDAPIPGQVAFLSGAQRVNVGSHTARLVTSRLFSVLVLDDGRIAVGAVTPAALEAAVASAG